MFRSMQSLRRAATIVAALGVAIGTFAGVTRSGREYYLAVPMPGDQARPDLALGPSGGYLVWEDNVGDGDGLAVNVRRVTSSLNGELNVMPLATKTAGNQEQPKVSMLSNGGAAFVWQGGPDGRQQVYLRVMTAGGTFLSDEFAVSAAGGHQIQAAVAGLSNGNIVVVWTAPDQNETGVFGALFGPQGQRLGGEFQINQFSISNQRNAVVSALPDGKFVVGWISEGQRSDQSVDLYARIYAATGAPMVSEFRVNDSERVASSPAVTTTATGNFTFAWCEVDQDANIFEGTVTQTTSGSRWDIYACGFTSGGGRLSLPNRVNQHLKGNQINPSIAAVGTTQFVVWTSVNGQDGDREGVFGRALSGIGGPEGDETQINTAFYGPQVQPVVRGNGDSRFVVAWSTFSGLANNMEISGQRFDAEQSLVVLPQPPAPYVSALTQSRLSVAWPSVDGYDVLNYELYVDGAFIPILVTNQMKVITGLAPGTTHTFEISYRLRDGQLSPRSGTAIAVTWAEDGNEDGLPDDWQAKYWGADSSKWPSPNADSDGDGVSNQREYLAGTDPTDANSVLRTRLLMTPQGPRLSWDTKPGSMYQVQQTSDLSTWTDLGGQRFAPGTTDSMAVPVGNSLGYYRVNRIR
jgi:hypothetical protein